jgi:hypothetical protein
MLEIIIENNLALDLYPDFSLNIISENPLLLQDRIPSPYTSSFEAPPTRHNLEIFGMPNRVTSSGVLLKKAAEIRHFGYNVMRGEILFINFETSLKLQFVGSITPSNITKNLNEIEDFDSFDLGLMRWTVQDPPDYSQPYAEQYVDFMNNAALTGNPFVIAPIRLSGEAWEGDEDGNGLYNLIKIYANYFNAPNQTLFPFDDPLYPEQIKHCHTPVLPAVYVQDILNAIFGTALKNSPFATGDLAKLVVPTINHKNYTVSNIHNLLRPDNLDLFLPIVENYDLDTRDDFEMIVKIQSFQQAYSAKEFLKNILKMFSMTIFPGTTWSIEKNDDIMNRNVIVDWSEKMVNTPSISVEKAKQYQFSYGSNSINENTTNRVKYNNLVEIFDYAMSTSENIDEYLEDITTGYRYKTNKIITDVAASYGFPGIIICEVNKSPLAIVYPVTTDEIYPVVSEVKPLETIIDQYWIRKGPQIKKYHWHVPTIARASLTDAPNIMIYAGNRKTFKTYHTLPEVDVDFDFPYLSNSNYDINGSKFCEFSLSPQGADGLISKFHTKLKQWVEKDKKRLKASFHLSVSEIRNINMRDKIYVVGRNFYIEKIEYQIFNSGISLVEADLIEC